MATILQKIKFTGIMTWCFYLSIRIQRIPSISIYNIKKKWNIALHTDDYPRFMKSAPWAEEAQILPHRYKSLRPKAILAEILSSLLNTGKQKVHSSTITLPHFLALITFYLKLQLFTCTSYPPLINSTKGAFISDSSGPQQ